MIQGVIERMVADHHWILECFVLVLVLHLSIVVIVPDLRHSDTRADTLLGRPAVLRVDRDRAVSLALVYGRHSELLVGAELTSQFNLVDEAAGVMV